MFNAFGLCRSCGAGLGELANIPAHRHLQPLADAMGRLVAQASCGLTDISQRVTHITGTEVTVDGMGIFEMGKSLAQVVTKEAEEDIEARAVANRNIVDLIGGFRVFAGGSKQVCLDGVIDITEVAAGFAIAVDIHRLAVDHTGDPFRDDRCVGTVGVLPLAEDVEVAQADGLEPIGAGKNIGIKFIDQFGDRIGREWLTNVGFNFRQCRVVAIGGTAGGVDETFDFGITGGDQHVEEAADVGVVGGDGVFDGSGHGP